MGINIVVEIIHEYGTWESVALLIRISSSPHCVFQLHSAADNKQTHRDGSWVRVDLGWWWWMWWWWWGGLRWCGGLSKHSQDNWGTTKQPASKPQRSMLRQNTKWSRLQYYPAFTTPTVWGNLYDESWRDFFFFFFFFFLYNSLPLALPLSLSLLSLLSFFMLVLMNSSVPPPLLLSTSTL